MQHTRQVKVKAGFMEYIALIVLFAVGAMFLISTFRPDLWAAWTASRTIVTPAMPTAVVPPIAAPQEQPVQQPVIIEQPAAPASEPVANPTDVAASQQQAPDDYTEMTKPVQHTLPPKEPKEIPVVEVQVAPQRVDDSHEGTKPSRHRLP